jgi:hypothetical protein
VELLRPTLIGMLNLVEEVVGQQRRAQEHVKEVITHRGEWNGDSRECLALRFLEKYVSAVDLKERAMLQPGKFYAPLAIYHDVKGKALVGGRSIWDVSDLFMCYTCALSCPEKWILMATTHSRGIG